MLSVCHFLLLIEMQMQTGDNHARSAYPISVTESHPEQTPLMQWSFPSITCNGARSFGSGGR
jgi:hypothetical protein